MSASAEPLDGVVLVTWIDFDVGHPAVGGALREAGLSLRLAPKLGDRGPDELAALLDGAVGAIVSTDPFDATVFARAPRLRVIARVGVGTDSIDLGAATRAGVAVTTTPGANHETVADHTLAVLLAAVRRIVEHDAGVRRGEWNRAGDMTAWELHGRTAGIVGYGLIGQAVARRLAGFGVDVLVSDPLRETAGDLQLVELDELLARSDVVLLHAPLTSETRGLMNAARLSRMKRDAILVNTSRGPLVDEEALADALESGRLRAAALDVFALEPLRSDRLRQLPNVVLSPHVGGLSDSSIAEMTRRAAQSVIAVLRGSDLSSVINPAALELTSPEAAV
jgi:D-3-phosphoglycerate dehydrogenase